MVQLKDGSRVSVSSRHCFSKWPGPCVPCFDPSVEAIIDIAESTS